MYTPSCGVVDNVMFLHSRQTELQAIGELLWPSCVADADIIFLPCSSFYLSFFFPRLISAVADWMSTELRANLRCRSETCCTRLAENTEPKKSPKNRHLRTIAQICRAVCSQLWHVSIIGKKVVKQQYLLHVSSQHGERLPTKAETGLPVWGTQAHFNEFRALAASLHSTVVTGVSQTLRR